MNDPQSLREIAEQACNFDQIHFSDDIAPTPETILSNHERLPDDPKLITRLRPRFISALAYFEGYMKAADIAAEMKRNIKRELGADPNKNIWNAIEESKKERGLSGDVILMELSRTREAIHSLSAFANATEVRDAAVGLVQSAIDRFMKTSDDKPEPIDRQNIGIVLRPPPPPPPPAAPMPNEISDELAQAAAEFANDEEGYSTTAGDIDEVRDAMKAGKGWYAVARAFVHGARWHTAQVSSYPANKVQNSECKQYELTIRQKNERIAELEKQLDDELANLTETARENVKLANETIELRATIENTAKQGAEWRDLLEKSETERLAMKQERDRAIAKVRVWEARTGETQPRIVEAKLNENRLTSVVFRDAAETEYWDEMTFMLARKGDTTSKSVASAADEMVEERRARMPQNGLYSETKMKDSIDFEAQANEITRRLLDSEDFIERFRIELAKALGKDEVLSLGDALSMVCLLAKAQSAEVTDELLLEAASWANSVCEMVSGPIDLAAAKSAMNGNVVFELRWSNAVRSYVNGALRKARKT